MDLTIAPGESNSKGSRIVLRDGSEVQQPCASGALTPIREREGDIARTCIPLQLMGQMPIILIAMHELREQNDTPKEQLGYIPPDLSSAAGREPDVQDREECKVQETLLNHPPEVPVEHTPDNDFVGEDAHETAHSVVSGGEFQCSGNVLAFIELTRCGRRREL